MTDAEKRGGLATAFHVAYIGALFLLGVQAARWVGYVVVCVSDYFRGK